jgi:hypothetical protein
MSARGDNVLGARRGDDRRRCDAADAGSRPMRLSPGVAICEHRAVADAP